MVTQSATATRYQDNAADHPLDSEAAATGKTVRHWRLFIDRHDIAWLTIDQPGTLTNRLSAVVIEELNQLLLDLAAAPPRGLIISSGKSGGFITGAGIGELSRLGSHAEIEDYLRRAHVIFARLEQLPCPTIALLHGFCSGAGLELALACRYRIVRDDTRLGFPEIKHGLHAGLGGTRRLTRLLPATTALTLLVTGDHIDADKARSIGLVDAVVPQCQLYTAAVNCVLNGLQTRRSSTVAFYNSAPVRALLAWWMHRRLRQKVSPQDNPAPFALIELWHRYGGRRERLLRAEARSLAHLVSGTPAPERRLPGRSVSQQLVAQ
jgi:3-hydroxyacyl-CoA dehydrogenase/enoyl-CoA hydratase/3-hydroxybutyryl-CoA epimerase